LEDDDNVMAKEGRRQFQQQLLLAFFLQMFAGSRNERLTQGKSSRWRRTHVKYLKLEMFESHRLERRGKHALTRSIRNCCVLFAGKRTGIMSDRCIFDEGSVQTATQSAPSDAA
jgi:hypothetical protein